MRLSDTILWQMLKIEKPKSNSRLNIEIRMRSVTDRHSDDDPHRVLDEPALHEPHAGVVLVSADVGTRAIGKIPQKYRVCAQENMPAEPAEL